MAILDRSRNGLGRSIGTPIWHTTSNHTVYNKDSENIFREILKMPANGPPGQQGLSYSVRRGDLLMVFVNTVWSGLGGEGHTRSKPIILAWTYHRT
jgi:hypothetical protein